MEVSIPKMEWKLNQFPIVFGVDTSINPKNISFIIYQLISMLFMSPALTCVTYNDCCVWNLAEHPFVCLSGSHTSW